MYCSLVAWSEASAAETRSQRPQRTTLPTDKTLSVSVGVKAAWQSVIYYDHPKRITEIPAEVSAYDLTETPTRDNLADHQLTLPALPEDPAWYAFEPTTDKVSLTIDIVDTDRRLGKIVLSDLRTGRVLGSIFASADGYSVRGQFKILWEQPFYRIEGYDSRNVPLFRLGVSHGQPDTFVHLTVAGEFAPYRPATVSSPRFTEKDPGKGVEGDPYDLRGVTLSTHAGGGFSLGYVAFDQKNDAPVTNPLQAPGDYGGYFKKACIERLGWPAGYALNDKMDKPGYADDVRAEQQEDKARGVSDLIQPPYSDCTGRWSVRFIGKATAFLLVPYTVARQKGRLADLKSLLGTLAKRLPDANIHTLAFGLEEAFAIWLQSDAGTRSGYTRGMFKALGDVKTVETQVDRKDFVVMRGHL